MSDRTARLDGEHLSLVLDLSRDGAPVVLWFGPRLEADIPPELAVRAVPHSALDVDHPSASLLPTLGTGLFGIPALGGSRDGRDWTAVPGPFAAVSRPGGLTLTGADPVARLAVAIDLELQGGVLVARTSVTNNGDAPYRLDWLAALTLAVPAACDDLLAFAGKWTLEWRETRERLGLATWLRETRRGRTSHDAFPALAIGEAGFGEEHGLVYGFHLAWSGNHRTTVEPLDDGRRSVQMGALLMPGEVILAPGETFATPALHVTVSTAGLNGLMRRLHEHVRRHVLSWPGGAMRPRPVTLNTWEANYFAHDETRLRAQAEAAAALGVERFVLDDGWFKGRSDDLRALGDWTTDPGRYPHGLGPLIDHVCGLGMEFGLWVEPEMVNPDSDLFRAHPEWALQVAGRPMLTGRNQLVLDLTRPPARDYLAGVLDDLLGKHSIAYLKWDMNRDLVAAGDCEGRPAYHRQTQALYALLDRLRTKHPHVEIESCASGGGRADYGILARTHRIWTSDGTDALERQRVQRGFALFLPPEVMGAHISATPNHQTGRRHTLAFRAATALTGHLGLELDPLALADDERAELRAWIALHRRLRPLLHGGVACRLAKRDGRLGHGVVAADAGRAVFVVAQLAHQVIKLPPSLPLPGLDPQRSYRVSLPPPQRPAFFKPTAAQQALLRGDLVVSGAVLRSVGVQLPELHPETALVVELESTDQGGNASWPR